MLHYTFFILFNLFCSCIFKAAECQEKKEDGIQITSPKLTTDTNIAQSLIFRPLEINGKQIKNKQMYGITFTIQFHNIENLKQYLGDDIEVRVRSLEVFFCPIQKKGDFEYCDAKDSVSFDKKQQTQDDRVLLTGIGAQKPQKHDFIISLKNTEKFENLEIIRELIKSKNKRAILLQVTLEAKNKSDSSIERTFTFKTPASKFSDFDENNNNIFLEKVETRNLSVDKVNSDIGSVTSDSGVQSPKQETYTRVDNREEETPAEIFQQEANTKNKNLCQVEQVEKERSEQNINIEKEAISQPAIAEPKSPQNNKSGNVVPTIENTETEQTNEENNASTSTTLVSRTESLNPKDSKRIYWFLAGALCVFFTIVVLVIKIKRRSDQKEARN
ncbi:hypothetical protein CDIK_1827 [Cucumispora dikerogammari]|nr:hypothetical protein CDIK_1827 [Cucumispora dikerogammari]